MLHMSKILMERSRCTTACSRWGRDGESVETFKLMLDLYPEAARQVDGHGRLPLHRVLDERALSEDATLTLLEAHPEGASIQDDGGHLPLHYASSASLSVVTKLLQIYPEGVTVMKSNGFLPLHSACNFARPCPSFSVVRCLVVEAHPPLCSTKLSF